MKFNIRPASPSDYNFAILCAGRDIIKAIDGALAEIRESGDKYIIKEIRAEGVRSTDDLETALNNMVEGGNAHCDVLKCSEHGWDATFLMYPTMDGRDTRLIFMITVVDQTLFD